MTQLDSKDAMKYEYSDKLHIASVSSSSDWHNLCAHTLLQNPGQKQPSINAFLGARYSRSSDSIRDIALEVMEKGTDTAKRLESIFHGYGHKSVGDMADLFIAVEKVPMILAMRLFNSISVLAGQERSTRFQNFSNPEYIGIPNDLGVSEELIELYDGVIDDHMKNYRELLEPTKIALAKYFEVDVLDKSQKGALEARTFDTVRYFLPVGLETNLAFVTSARTWSEIISQLRGSNQKIDSELAEVLFSLLAPEDEFQKLGYVPEADSLIRHTEAITSRLESSRELMQLLNNNESELNQIDSYDERGRYLEISNASAAFEVLNHAQLLNDPLSVIGHEFSKKTLERAGEIVFKQHNHHNLIGNLAQSGAITIDGIADLGTLKDLNRHRSMERFVPLWENEVNLEAELNRSEEDLYLLCNYLEIDELKDLRGKFIDRMNESYQKIKKFHKLAVSEQGIEFAREYTRYLLPHAHATRYRFYGSVDDLQYTIHLRTRNGGHISYRQDTYDWLESLAKENAFWKPMLDRIPKVDAADREQFLSRG